jgi:hypothetical protein
VVLLNLVLRLEFPPDGQDVLFDRDVDVLGIDARDGRPNNTGALASQDT